MSFVPEDTLSLYWFPPYDATITGVEVFAVVAPASAAGTYTMAASDDSGNNLLSVATYDLEGLVNLTYSSAPLTATAADLLLTTTEHARFDFVSSNQDLSGAGLSLLVHYRRT